jgi:hypothetical protein
MIGNLNFDRNVIERMVREYSRLVPVDVLGKEVDFVTHGSIRKRF